MFQAWLAARSGDANVALVEFAGSFTAPEIYPIASFGGEAAKAGHQTNVGRYPANLDSARAAERCRTETLGLRTRLTHSADHKQIGGHHSVMRLISL